MLYIFWGSNLDDLTICFKFLTENKKKFTLQIPLKTRIESCQVFFVN